ncbi:MAG: hypothetical protein J3K34DRAFT_411756, partial [Monoraphidium minutum]
IAAAAAAVAAAWSGAAASAASAAPSACCCCCSPAELEGEPGSSPSPGCTSTRLPPRPQGARGAATAGAALWGAACAQPAAACCSRSIHSARACSSLHRKRSDARNVSRPCSIWTSSVSLQAPASASRDAISSCISGRVPTYSTPSRQAWGPSRGGPTDVRARPLLCACVRGLCWGCEHGQPSGPGSGPIQGPGCAARGARSCCAAGARRPQPLRAQRS